MPAALSEAEVAAEVQLAVAATGAAGPQDMGKVMGVLKGKLAGRADAIAFIESIPFSETRGYVKNVLAYDVFYRYFLRQPAKLLTDAEWQRLY